MAVGQVQGLRWRSGSLRSRTRCAGLPTSVSPPPKVRVVAKLLAMLLVQLSQVGVPPFCEAGVVVRFYATAEAA